AGRLRLLGCSEALAITFRSPSGNSLPHKLVFALRARFDRLLESPPPILTGSRDIVIDGILGQRGELLQIVQTLRTPECKALRHERTRSATASRSRLTRILTLSIPNALGNQSAEGQPFWRCELL